MAAEAGSAREVVEEALDHVAAWLAKDGAEADLHVAHAEGVIAGLESTGGLTGSEATDFRKRLFALRTEEESAGAEQRDGGATDLDAAPDVLQRVLAGPAATRFLDGQLQVIVVEVHAHSVVVQWRLAPLPSLAALRASAPKPDRGTLESISAHWRRLIDLPRHAELKDDAGTRYRRTHFQRQPGPGEFLQRWRFVPSLPPEATLLIARFDEAEISVPVRQPAT